MRWLADDELQFLRRCVNLRTQSLEFQLNEFTKDDVPSSRFTELYKEQCWCYEMLAKLNTQEEQS